MTSFALRVDALFLAILMQPEGIVELRAALLSYGAGVEVIEPLSLADEIDDEIAKMWAARSRRRAGRGLPV